MTNERIDVLAVMDHWIESEVAYGADCTDLIAARATVAELIEANRELLTTIAKSVSVLRWEQLKVAVDHNNAALARVGGVDG